MCSIRLNARCSSPVLAASPTGPYARFVPERFRSLSGIPRFLPSSACIKTGRTELSLFVCRILPITLKTRQKMWTHFPRFGHETIPAPTAARLPAQFAIHNLQFSILNDRLSSVPPILRSNFLSHTARDSRSTPTLNKFPINGLISLYLKL